MTKPNYAHMSILVDRSGSMSSLAQDATAGINSMIQEQAQVDGDFTVSLYDFDDQFEHVFGPIEGSKAPEYQLQPRNQTALFDSAWRAINDTGDWLGSLPETQRPEKVVFAIVTDGLENASVELQGTAGRDKLKGKIEEQTNQWGWEFIYLASHADAFAYGQSLGIMGTTQNAPTGAAYRSAYSNLSSSMANSRMTGASVMDTMPEEIDDQGNAIKSSSKKSQSASTDS